MKLNFFLYLVITAVAVTILTEYAKFLQEHADKSSEQWYVVALVTFIVGTIVTMRRAVKDGLTR